MRVRLPKMLAAAALLMLSRLSVAQAGRIVVVLPFENRSQQTSLDWIGESFPEILNQRLSGADFFTLTRDDRAFALDRLGLPTTFRPSRATTFRIAQEIDADYVIVGSYTVENGIFSAQAQVLDVRKTHMSQPLAERADLQKLLDVENGIAWQTIRFMDPQFSVAETAYVTNAQQLRLDAFESYVRGVTASTSEERLRRLKEAVQLSPNYVPAIFLLGRTYFTAQQYEQAAALFPKVPQNHPLAIQAHFLLGLTDFYLGNYAGAEDSFAFVAARLPLPEVLNNQGVAATRHGKDGTALFNQAIAADPKDADYHFNLAVSLQRKGDLAGAASQIRECLTLRATDTEAIAVQTALQRRSSAPSGSPYGEEDPPRERIKRSFNETAFREAVFALQLTKSLKAKGTQLQ